MKSSMLIVAASATLLLLAGCAGKYEDASSAGAAKEQAAAAPLSSQAAEEKTEENRQFIRTSDLKFRVKDVAQATYRIEDITRSFNGFVTYTHLETMTEDKKVTPVSADSAVETLQYTMVNNMTIRVPNVKLDSTLKAIATLVDFIDFRTIKADDVALQIKANQLTRNRALNNGQRIRTAIDNKGKKLAETSQAEDVAADRQREADDAAIANLSLMDQVQYSTVTLSLYQRAETRRWIIPNGDNASNYRSGLALRVWDSIKSGWYLLEDLLVLLIRLWVPLLIALVAWIVYRRYKSGKLLVKS